MSAEQKEPAAVIKSDEKAATAPTTRALKFIVAVIAIVMSVYHMYVAAFGPPEAMIFRGTHLLFALTLVFLLYPLKPGGGWKWRIADFVLLLGSWAMKIPRPSGVCAISWKSAAFSII